MSTVELRVHPLAAVIPEMAPETFAALKEDISKNGVKVPVWLHRGRILDGRNRFRACRELGLECPTIDVKDGKPLSDLLSLNLIRRHMDESQRAMVAATIANLRHGGDRRSSAIKRPKGPLISQEKASEMLKLDSLYRGYPSGAILVWETDREMPNRNLAVEQSHSPFKGHKLLLDGQQRLTSLTAILRGKPVTVRDRRRPIDILFNLAHPDGPPVEVIDFRRHGRVS